MRMSPHAPQPVVRARVDELGPHATTLSDDAIAWLAENRKDLDEGNREILGSMLGSVGNAARWRPPALILNTYAQLKALPAGAFFITEQGGYFSVGDDGLMYEPGNATPMAPEQVCLPVEVHINPADFPDWMR